MQISVDNIHQLTIREDGGVDILLNDQTTIEVPTEKVAGIKENKTIGKNILHVLELEGYHGELKENELDNIKTEVISFMNSVQIKTVNSVDVAYQLRRKTKFQDANLFEVKCFLGME